MLDVDGVKKDRDSNSSSVEQVEVVAKRRMFLLTSVTSIFQTINFKSSMV